MAVFVIAEIGVCHDGDLNKALRLVDAAKEAGADAAKFQYFSSQKLWKDDRIKHLELRYSEFVKIHQHCQDAGVEFMCTPFGVEELFLLKPHVKRWKIASGCITRKPILEMAAETKLPVIMSTGMSTLPEIGAAVDVLGAGPLTLLHCTSAYPCPIEAVNLKAMMLMKMIYGRDVGYSDHTVGITVPIAAAALGASVIEKHITLDRNATGPDHKTSLEPDEFRVMVRAIRTVEEALGDGTKRVMAAEEALRKTWRA